MAFMTTKQLHLGDMPVATRRTDNPDLFYLYVNGVEVGEVAISTMLRINSSEPVVSWIARA